MANQKYVRKIGFTTIIGFSLVLGISSLLYSEEPSEKTRAHVSGNFVEPGDIISADILNELFEQLHDIQKGFSSPAELVGTWSCDAFYTSHPKIYPHPDYSVSNEWTISEDGLTMSLTGATITFSDNGDGTYSFTTSAPNPFHYVDSGSFSSPFELVSNWFFYQREYVVNGENRKSFPYYSIEKIGENRFIFRKEGAGGQRPLILSCTNQNVAPIRPTNLTAASSGLTVNLTWTDNSHDETGFKILRKTSLTDVFSETAAVGADVTGFSDTVGQAGDYWYRVKATNENGDSFGSNLVTVTVSN